MSKNPVARPGRCIAAAFLFLFLLPLAALATPVNSGHAGHWSAPERDGEGWVLELLDADTALLYWFTYDETGNQRWLTAVGQVQADGDGARLDFPQLVVTHGARFGADFDPAAVVREAVGSARLEFDGCDRAHFDYQAFGQTGTLQLTRLAHVMATACERRHGVPGRPAASHAGLSGSWFDPERSGEGFTLQLINPTQAILIWFTYDSTGRQYWIFGEGLLDGEGRIVAQMHATHGGRFGADFDPAAVERFAWGEVTLTIDCAGGFADYASVLPAFGSGRRDLQHLTAIAGVPCPWQPPKLTDLYEAEFVELPSRIAEPDWLAAVILDRSYINDAGAVWAAGGPAGSLGLPQALGLAPGDTVWRRLGMIRDVLHLAAGAQGEVVMATQRVGMFEGLRTLRWDGEEWHAVDPEISDGDLLEGMSANGLALLISRSAGGTAFPRQFRWDEVNGRQELARGGYSSAIATMLGDNSGPLVGRVSAAPGSAAADQMALVWTDPRQPPQRPSGPLMDPDNPGSLRWILVSPSACSSDCGIIFGDDAVVGDDATQFRAEPWYLLADGRSAFLGQVNAGSQTRYAIRGGAQDGSLVAGRISLPRASAFAAGTVDGFIWTPLTGMSALGTFLQDGGLPVDDWVSAEIRIVSPNGLRMVVRFQTGEPRHGLGLLTLVPRGD